MAALLAVNGLPKLSEPVMRVWHPAGGAPPEPTHQERPVLLRVAAKLYMFHHLVYHCHFHVVIMLVAALNCSDHIMAYSLQLPGDTEQAGEEP